MIIMRHGPNDVDRDNKAKKIYFVKVKFCKSVFLNCVQIRNSDLTFTCLKPS